MKKLLVLLFILCGISLHASDLEAPKEVIESPIVSPDVMIAPEADDENVMATHPDTEISPSFSEEADNEEKPWWEWFSEFSVFD